MQLPGYSNLTRLSRGGMSTVYTATQDSLDRKVAIKLLAAEFHNDDAARQFFDQESLVIARLNHPNIIAIIDRGFNDRGRPYFVMEYVEGEDLAQVQNSRKLSLNSKIQLMMQICRGVAFAHKNDIVHRDIKPANILVDRQGHVRILDFGIAWLQTSDRPTADEIVGTPDYMSPEQFSDPGAISPLSDIYSIGAVMYELFSGTLPAQHFNDLAMPLSGLPAELSQLILQCLQTGPQNRPLTADELSFRLIRTLHGAHITIDDKKDAHAALGSAAQKFHLLDVLSRTRYSSVYLFEDRQRNRSFIVKKRRDSQTGYEQATRLKSISHDNIVPILGTSRNARSFIVVMAHLPGGSLQDRLSRKFNLPRFIDNALKICAAMITAHANEVFHGDLRPSNILYDDKGMLRLSDFGFEHHYLESREHDWYQPESRPGLSASRDIYSAGIIFHQMLTGNLPTVRYAEFKPDREFQNLAPDLQEMISAMINQQSVNRIQDFSEVQKRLQRMQAALPTRPARNLPEERKWNRGWIALLIVIINLLLAAYLFLF